MAHALKYVLTICINNMYNGSKFKVLIFQNVVIGPNLLIRNSVRNFSVVLDFEVMCVVKKKSEILFSSGIVHYFVDSLS